MMKYCMECGTELIMRELEGEGTVPYCKKCGEYRFPVFSTAVSMEVQSPDRSRILLIKQYGKDRYILVAGYINKGECAEHAVLREVKEEIGVDVTDIHFQKSEYFPKSNTLMLNFSCVAATDDLAHVSEKEIDSCRWFTREEAAEHISHGSLAERFLTNFLESTSVLAD